MTYLTSIDPKLLTMLAVRSDVGAFRDLLWAEASRAGIGPALVSVPSSIHVADGGIDAEVSSIPPETKGGILFPGFTRYQIKTGSFTAGNKSDKEKLFLNEDGTFKERVRTCFEKG